MPHCLIVLYPFLNQLTCLAIHLDNVGSQVLARLISRVLIDQIPQLGVGSLRVGGILKGIRCLQRDLVKDLRLVDCQVPNVCYFFFVEWLVGFELQSFAFESPSAQSIYGFCFYLA